MEEEMHLMMFTEAKEDCEIFWSNFSKYGDSNGALVKQSELKQYTAILFQRCGKIELFVFP